MAVRRLFRARLLPLGAGYKEPGSARQDCRAKSEVPTMKKHGVSFLPTTNSARLGHAPRAFPNPGRSSRCPADRVMDA